MEEKMLLEWKEAHAEVYAKFKEDLEGCFRFVRGWL